MATPERWKTAMRASGYSSIRSLASDAGLSPTAVSEIMQGLRRPHPGTRAKLLAHLTMLDRDVPMTEAGFHKLVTGKDEEVDPFHLPDGAERLSPRQREAVTKVVLAFLEDRDAAAPSTEKKTDPTGPVTQEKTPARTGGRWLKPVPSVAKPKPVDPTLRVARGKKRDAPEKDR